MTTPKRETPDIETSSADYATRFSGNAGAFFLARQQAAVMDLLATPMHDCFTAEPDFTPYTCRPNQVPLDQLNVALEKLEGPARRDALASQALNLDEIDMADEAAFNRILWHAMKGHDIPYPAAYTMAGKR